ncbi:Methenyltetrahydrofolate cyclohydrolase [bioreactor metagenome]|uniref:Methenyltetrahydrofolate cyclohydrolase n=1 Tax=bioreactor metagenome TaxID=1076179 RepID=A0A645HZI3_9ZZZZ
MVSMVGNLTIGKEKYKEVEPQAIEIVSKSADILKKLEDLTEKDISMFGSFMDVIKMPKDTDEQKGARTVAMQKALIDATDTPMEIARVCLSALELADELADYGNKGAISDVGVAAVVAEAALNSVLLSVDINVPGIKDKAYVDKVNTEKVALITKAKELREKTVLRVKERM